ncbi:MAG: hypothetical protein PUP93_26980 [Rhizonema sp. NSF051]|nr:hypothetical protein [Rhizonema sp. NSF051]
MYSIFAKLQELGFSQDYVMSHGLPDWWDKELNTKPLAVLEGASCIAENLNVDLKWLLSEEK